MQMRVFLQSSLPSTSTTPGRASAAPRPGSAYPEAQLSLWLVSTWPWDPAALPPSDALTLRIFSRGSLLSLLAAPGFQRSNKPPFCDARSVSRPSPAADDMGHPGPSRWPLLPPRAHRDSCSVSCNAACPRCARRLDDTRRKTPPLNPQGRGCGPGLLPGRPCLGLGGLKYRDF